MRLEHIRRYIIIIIIVSIILFSSLAWVMFRSQRTGEEKKPGITPEITRVTFPTQPFILNPTETPPDFTGAELETLSEQEAKRVAQESSLRSRLPIRTNEFEITYNYATYQFIVNLKEPFQANKQVFIQWLQTSGYDALPLDIFIFITVTAIPQTPTITISGVSMNNFLLNPKEVNERGDMLIEDNKDYTLLFYTKTNAFLLSILSSPFETIRKNAEAAFLQKLQITQTDACRLKVTITTPRFANPEYAGKTYHLSFCT